LELAPGSVSLSCTSQQQQGSGGSGGGGAGGSVEVRCTFLLRPGEEQEGEAPIEEGVGVGEVRWQAALLVAAAARCLLQGKYMTMFATCTALHSPALLPCLRPSPAGGRRALAV
jgi:hypothetical protein